MAGRPAAEVRITPDLVRHLLSAQHADLAGLPLREVSHGWDNAVVRLGDDLAVRLPRRALSAPLLLNELRWLPELAPRLPVAVPVPLRAGAPTAAYPWPWAVVPWLPGTLVADLPLADRAPLADPLARAVAALRRDPAPADAPRNPVRGVPLAARDEDVRARIASGSVPRGAESMTAWRAALVIPPWAGPPVWLHGDLHPANLLVSTHPPGPRRLAGLLDFGDLTSGDPATDLAAAWLTFDAAGRAAFRRRLNSLVGADEATWARARGWALVLATAMLAHSDDDPVLARVGLSALAQVLDHPGT